MQNFVDRLLLGYSWHGGCAAPTLTWCRFTSTSFPPAISLEGGRNDSARQFSRRSATRSPSGGSKLAVDGVLIIGEHGKYPRNEKGQMLYPRYEFFKQVVKVFEVERPQCAGFQRQTSLDGLEEVRRNGRRLEAARIPLPGGFVAAGHAPVSGSGCPVGDAAHRKRLRGLRRHPIRTIFMDWRRHNACPSAAKAARSGLRVSMPCVAKRSGKRSRNVRRLSGCCWRRCREATHFRSRRDTSAIVLSIEWARKLLATSLAYFIDHRDGFKTTLFLLPIRDFNYAGLNGETGEIISCQMNLPMPTQSATTANFFNPLIRHIERMVVENRAPYPVERTLLTSGMTLAAVESLFRGEIPVQTAEMEVRYTCAEGIPILAGVTPLAASDWWRYRRLVQRVF